MYFGLFDGILFWFVFSKVFVMFLMFFIVIFKVFFDLRSFILCFLWLSFIFIRCVLFFNFCKFILCIWIIFFIKFGGWSLFLRLIICDFEEISLLMCFLIFLIVNEWLDFLLWMEIDVFLLFRIIRVWVFFMILLILFLFFYENMCFNDGIVFIFKVWFWRRFWILCFVFIILLILFVFIFRI